MNIKGLSNNVRFSKTPFFNVCREFYNAFALNPKFKPFHIYLFRTDLLYDSIVEKKSLFIDAKEKYLTKEGKINYRNKTVRTYVEDYAQIYIGNTFYKFKFCPLFISRKKMYDNEGFNLINTIHGYAIDTDNADDPYFNNSTIKLLGKMSIEDMKMRIEFVHDIRLSLEKLSELTKDALERIL